MLKFIVFVQVVFSLMANYSPVLAGPLNPCQQGTAYISISLHKIPDIDTVTLRFWRETLTDERDINIRLPHLVKRASKGKDGLYRFQIQDIDKTGYVSINYEKDTLFGRPEFVIDKYLVRAGDSIRIDIYRKKVSKHFLKYHPFFGYNLIHRLVFNGVGAMKYKCRYTAEMKNITYPAPNAPDFLYYNDTIHQVHRHDTALQITLSTLKNFQGLIDPLCYKIMRADFIGKYRNEKYHDFLTSWVWNGIGRKLKNVLNRLSEVYKTMVKEDQHFRVDKDIAIKSAVYTSYLLRKKIASYRVNGIDDKSEIYFLLKKQLKGALRDKVLTIYLLRKFKVASDLQYALNDAIHTVNTDYCLEQLRNLSNAISTGAEAYNFTLPDTANKMVSLDDFRGKVVFLDFWFTGCGACTSFYQNNLSPVERKYQSNSEVVFISISIDRDKRRWLHSIRSGNYTSHQKNVINLYTNEEGGDHEVIRRYFISGYPTCFLIDRQGRISCSSQKELRLKDKLEANIRELLYDE